MPKVYNKALVMITWKRGGFVSEKLAAIETLVTNVHDSTHKRHHILTNKDMPQLVVRTLIPEHIQELESQGIPQNQPETIPITHLEKTDVFFINFDSQSKKTKKKKMERLGII